MSSAAAADKFTMDIAGMGGDHPCAPSGQRRVVVVRPQTPAYPFSPPVRRVIRVFAERIRTSSGHLSEKGQYGGARADEVQREFKPSELAQQALSRLARIVKLRGYRLSSGGLHRRKRR